jgi:hypothetical protein
MKRKWLTVGIILLFVGVTIAPTINFNTVKASQADDLVEVTTQACGIKGYGNTTVKLTREQYQNLEKYLVEFRAKLNQTTTREEAVLLLKNAIIEIGKYDLVPNWMKVEQSLNNIIDSYERRVLPNLLFDNPPKYTSTEINNVWCLITGVSSNTYSIGLMGLLKIGMKSFSELASIIFYSEILHLLPVQVIGPVAFGINSGDFEHGGRDYPAHGWVFAISYFGLGYISGDFLGKIRYLEYSLAGGLYTEGLYIGIKSFSGLIIGFNGKRWFLGFTPYVNIENV